MNILLCHNHYRQPGGEDAVYRAERDLLLGKGHDLVEYIKHNEEIPANGGAHLAFSTSWSCSTYRDLRSMLSSKRPDLVHCHNTFPLISPSVHGACHDLGVPTIQTVHNYRLLCPAATFFRDGHACEDCLGRTLAWPAVMHACYRNSRPASATVAAMLAYNRLRGTWQRDVGAFIALTSFAREKLIQGGLPGERIHVKPNFLNVDPGCGGHTGKFALFAGRLSEGKGIQTLLKAWDRVSTSRLLVVAGTGPSGRPERKDAPNVEWAGHLSRERLFGMMKQAAFLIFPSECYEGFPMTIIEAFATGLPVVASRLGAMAEIIRDGETGLHFAPGDPEDLATKVEWAFSHPKEMAEMGRAARREYELKYTAERNYQMLMEIYQRAIEAHRS